MERVFLDKGAFYAIQGQIPEEFDEVEGTEVKDEVTDHIFVKVRRKVGNYVTLMCECGTLVSMSLNMALSVFEQTHVYTAGCPQCGFEWKIERYSEEGEEPYWGDSSKSR